MRRQLNLNVANLDEVVEPFAFASRLRDTWVSNLTMGAPVRGKPLCMYINMGSLSY